jgi:hypothetical protein
LTTGDVARVLGVSAEGVRHLVRMAELTCERTVSGLRVFRVAEVRRLVVARADRRLHAVRAAPRMVTASLEPRQLALDFSARLKLVGSRGKGRKVA